MTRVFTSYLLILMFVTFAIPSAKGDVHDVLAGHDLFITKPGSKIQFSNNPIPAGFFEPGSAPFALDVVLQGKRLETYQEIDVGDMDTIVMRMNDTAIPLPLPGNDVVPIELVALSLESASPLLIDVNGQTQLWHLLVSPSPTAPSVGSMSITVQDAIGGTFDSTLGICPLLTFTRECDGLTRTLDLGGANMCLTLTTTSADWGYSPSAIGPAFPPLTTNLFPRGEIKHDASGAGKHNVEQRNGLLAPGEAFYRHGAPVGGTLGLYKVSPFGPPQLIMESPPFPVNVEGLAFASRDIVYASYYSHLYRVDLSTGNVVRIVADPTLSMGDIAFLPSTGELFTVSALGLGGEFVRMNSDGIILDRCSLPARLWTIAVSHEGRIVVGSYVDIGLSDLHVLAPGQCTLTALTNRSCGNDIDFSSNGNLFSYEGETIQQLCMSEVSEFCVGSCFPTGQPVVKGASFPSGISTVNLVVGPDRGPVILDADADGIPDESDNCPAISNRCQFDTNQNGIGDDCDAFASDGDIDLADYMRFSPCLTGPSSPVGLACATSDIDSSGMVDLTDWSLFQNSFGAP